MSVVKVLKAEAPLPPCNLEAEQSLLAGLLLDQQRFDDVVGPPIRLSPEHFYHRANGQLFQAMIELHDQRSHVDAITLADRLKSRGEFERMGGARFFSELFELVPDPASLPRYAEIIKDKALLRTLDHLGRSISTQSNDETAQVDELLDQISSQLMNVLEHRHDASSQRLEAILAPLAKQIIARRDAGVRFTGLKTGFPRLDGMTLGLQPSDLIILAARPSVGKTSLAINIAVEAAADKKKIAIFSLEMSAEQLALRLLASRGRIDTHRIKRGDVTNQELLNALHHLEGYELFIDDTPGITPLELRAKCRMLQRQHGLDMVIVDYLQLMQGPSFKRSDSRVQEISDISRALKGIARELRLPVLALSQLSRAVESRQDKRPQLSDLRESGAIEQDADIVMFLWRKEEGDTGNRHSEPRASLNEFRETQDLVLIIAKHRNGPTGEIELTFEKRYTNFAETMVGGGREVAFEDGY
ncbi:MAG: replicative DNA helicase [bacterium]